MNTYDRQALLLDILALELKKLETIWQNMQHILGDDERIAIESQRKMHARELSH